MVRRRIELSIKGLAYTVHLSGHQVVDGVANDIPRIAAYGEAEVSASARADLFGGLGFLTALLSHPGEQIEYEFNAEIDLGALYQTVRVKCRGIISLGWQKHGLNQVTVRVIPLNFNH